MREAPEGLLLARRWSHVTRGSLDEVKPEQDALESEERPSESFLWQSPDGQRRRRTMNGTSSIDTVRCHCGYVASDYDHTLPAYHGLGSCPSCGARLEPVSWALTADHGLGRHTYVEWSDATDVPGHRQYASVSIPVAEVL
jgi:hypothetical protein